MFNTPDRYEVNKKFAIKSFIYKELNPNDKKRLKETLREITMTHQISGEEIASLVNDQYNCQVVCFFSVKLQRLKDAAFVAGILHHIIKPLSILHFFDESSETYSFAYKRINKQIANEIIIEGSLLLKENSLSFPNETKQLLLKYLSIENITNKKNKLSFYIEIFVKAFIISNPNLYNNVIRLLEGKFWHNTDEVLETYFKLNRLNLLKVEVKKADRAVDKVLMNSEMKEIIQSMENIISGGI